MLFKNLPAGLLVFLVTLSPALGYAQPANDKSCSAKVLAPLPAPSSCPVGKGAITRSIYDNMNAKPSFPHPALKNCNGGSMAPLNSDVWFEVRTTGGILNITVKPAPGQNIHIKDPQISLYEQYGSTINDCLTSAPLACAVQTDGSGTLTVTWDFLREGARYLLQVGGKDTTDEGYFELELSNDKRCKSCVVESQIYTAPLPVMGRFQPNTWVLFFYVIKGYKNSNGTSLHAVAPKFGKGWDTATFNPYPILGIHPFPVSWTGSWDYYKNYPTNSGVMSAYFFNQNDGNPCNNVGDKAGASDSWGFFFLIKTKLFCFSAEDLSVEIETFSDGETGVNYPNPACSADPTFTYKPFLDCCASLEFLADSFVRCPGGPCNDTMRVKSSLNTKHDFNWYDDSGQFIERDTNTAVSTCTAICPGKRYTVISYDKTWQCISTVNKLAPSKLFVDVKQNTAGCGNACLDSTSVRVTNAWGWDISGSCQYQWSSGATTSKAVLCPGTHWVKVTGDGCQYVDTFITANHPPDDATFTYPLYTFCKFDQRTILPDFIALQGGTFSVAPSVGLNVDPQTGAINLLGSAEGSYTVTYSTNDKCPDSASVQIIIGGESTCAMNIYKGITPNGDGLNDRWVIEGIEFVVGSNVKIFNRWGGLVWQGDNYDNVNVVWSGTNQSNIVLPDGTYYYMITMPDSPPRKGWVELTR